MLDLDRGWERPAPTRAQVRHDVAWAVVFAAVAVASVEVWRSASPMSLGWRGVEGYLWFGLAGLALAGRRIVPLSTLLVESVIFFVVGERVVQLSGVFTIQMILFASLYAAWAWSRHTRRLLVVSAVVLVGMFGWVIWLFATQDTPPAQPTEGLLTPGQAIVTYSLLINVVYFLGAMAWGHVAWRSARQRAEIAERATRERQTQLEARERAVQAERVRIARDLHDVVAHHVSGIGVQAAGAGRVIDAQPESARRALSTIERSSRQAVTQMHQLVGLLRAAGGESGERVPSPGIEDIASLAGADERPRIEYREVGEPSPVPATVGLSLYRVAQEAVANVRRHADATTAMIVLRHLPPTGDTGPSVEIEVIDDGRVRASSATDDGSGGFGLVGIRERAAMHGGSAEIGPRPDSGFRVRVRIPLEAA